LFLFPRVPGVALRELPIDSLRCLRRLQYLDGFRPSMARIFFDFFVLDGRLIPAAAKA